MFHKLFIILLFLSFNLYSSEEISFKFNSDKECSIINFKKLVKKKIDLQFDFDNLFKIYKKNCLEIEHSFIIEDLEFFSNSLKKYNKRRQLLNNLKFDFRKNIKNLKNNDLNFLTFHNNCYSLLSKEAYKYYRDLHSWILENYYSKINHFQNVEKCILSNEDKIKIFQNKIKNWDNL